MKSVSQDIRQVLVLGATGYIGGRLIPLLLDAGFRVRCLARDPRKLEGRGWKNVEIVGGNVLDRVSLPDAMRGCDAVYHLVHSMGAGGHDFEEHDRQAARNVADAAAVAHVRRIIYLGGLGSRSSDLSPHLRSRNEVGKILAEGSVPVTEFRAAMIIGSGSASFEMMHALVNRLPVMTAPKWVSTRSQPIAIRDVLRYLVDTLTIPESAGKVIDIGGPDILSYKELMLRFAKLLGLKRVIIVVPVLTPRLSSLWINLVTPIPASIARPLIEGLKSEMVCESDLALTLFPFTPLSFDEAIGRAMQAVSDSSVETRWTNASIGYGEGLLDGTMQLLSDIRKVEVNAPAASVFRAFMSIGGNNGWYYGNILWRIRGFIDKLIGGVGLRRGRRHPTDLVPGDALDFWRVESVIPEASLTLRAEMKLPGSAWLEFTVESEDGCRSILTQTARFYPKGLRGLLYWYSIYPLHGLVFRGMAHGIARKALEMHRSSNQ